MGCSSRAKDRKSTRLNSSHTEIYTLSLHDALPISLDELLLALEVFQNLTNIPVVASLAVSEDGLLVSGERSEEHTSELQSHRDLHSFPTRRSSDLAG